ncbi:MAG TPA: hypothetical protein VGX76_02360 [Pirellulales bacterium]|jgi:hypothetical protein|nr:hypothetical protein [Pirellulales bacterium]
MRLAKTDRQGVVVGVYPDRPSAVGSMRRLQRNGIPIRNISIIDGDFRAIEQPLLCLTAGSMAKECAKVGAWTGGLFGLLVAAALLFQSSDSPTAGPLAVVPLGVIEDTLAGAMFGGLGATLVGLGLCKHKLIRYECQVKPGSFLLTLQGDDGQIQRAKSLLAVRKTDTAEAIWPVTTPARRAWEQRALPLKEKTDGSEIAPVL